MREMKLEYGKHDTWHPIIFINIICEDFKINIVERYESCESLDYGYDVKEVFFRVRTLDDILILNKSGNIKNKIKGDDFKIYYDLSKQLHIHNGRSKEFEKPLIEFIMKIYNENYI